MTVERVALLGVPAEAERLQLLREVVKNCAQSLGFCDSDTHNLVLAVNEACMNVIQHGYAGKHGEMILEVLVCSDAVEFRVRDNAPSIDLSRWRARKLEDLRPGGLGVHFIRQIMDEVRYLPIDDNIGNLLSMKKYRPRRNLSAEQRR